MVAATLASAQGPAPIAIAEEFKVGYQYHVNCRVNIKGELILPAEKKDTTPAATIAVTGSSVIKYDERVLELKAGAVDRTVRFYDVMNFERKAGKDDQGGSPAQGNARSVWSSCVTTSTKRSLSARMVPCYGKKSTWCAPTFLRRRSRGCCLPSRPSRPGG